MWQCSFSTMLSALVLLFPRSRWAQMAQHQLTVRHHADHKHNLHGLPTVVPLVTEGAAKLSVSDATTSCFLSQHRLHCACTKKQATKIIALQCVINEKKIKKSGTCNDETSICDAACPHIFFACIHIERLVNCNIVSPLTKETIFRHLSFLSFFLFLFFRL